MKLNSSLHEIPKQFMLRSAFVMGMMASLFAAHRMDAKGVTVDPLLTESVAEITAVRHEASVVESALHLHQLMNKGGNTNTPVSLEENEKIQDFLAGLRDVYQRAQNRYMNEKESFAKYPGLFDFPDFESLVMHIEPLLHAVESRPNFFSRIESLRQEQVTIETSKINRVATLEQLTKNIFEVYDPIQKNGLKASQNCVVNPLTKSWFQQTPFLKEYYKTRWMDRSITAESETEIPGSASGEVLAKSADSTRFQIVLDEIAYLRSISDQLPESPEKEWIMNANLEEMAQKESFIFIHDGSFQYDFTTQFASGIPLQQNYGFIKIHPLQTILMHEINMATGTFLPNDTHMTLEDVAAARKLKAEDPNKPMNPKMYDAFMGSDSYLGAINSAYILQKLSQI